MTKAKTKSVLYLAGLLRSPNGKHVPVEGMNAWKTERRDDEQVRMLRELLETAADLKAHGDLDARKNE